MSSYLINCQYFINLNGDRYFVGYEDGDEGDICILPYLIEKVGDSPYSYPIEKVGDSPYSYPIEKVKDLLNSYTFNAGILG